VGVATPFPGARIVPANAIRRIEMASFAKVTLNFTNNRDSWGESHTHQDEPNAELVVNHARALALLRVALCGQTTICERIDVSYPGIGQNGIYAFSFSGNENLSGPADPLAQEDEDYTGIRVRLRSFATQACSREHLLRGIPDNLVLQGTGPTGNTIWDAAFKAYTNVLCATPPDKIPTRWGFMATTRTGALLNRIPIAVAAQSGTDVAFTTSNPHPFKVGQKVKFRNLKFIPHQGFPRTAWVNKTTDVNHFTVTFTLTPQAEWVPGGTVEAISTFFAPYTSFSVEGMGTRKVGVGRHAHRGRRRSRTIGA
jgi:hypothetical protein